jgi:crotonobetaine/carnitine-CoA ligase
MSIPLSERTLVHVLRRRAADRPDQPWLIIEDRAVTYREADRLSNRLARGMLAQGIAAGDTLLVMLPDSLDLVLAWLACAKLGVIEVPLNTAYRGDILKHVIKDSRASAILIDSRFIERLQALGGEIGALRRCFARHRDGGQQTGLDALELEDLGDLHGEDERPIEREVRPGDLKAIMYTSGTTGQSKGVMVSHVHAYEYGNGCASVIEIGAEDIYYTAGLPLFHVAGKWGVLLGSAIKGATAVVPLKFSASNFWADIRRHRATATYLLGAMANFLQRQPPVPSDGKGPLRKVMMCPLLPDLDRFIARFNVRVCTAYGSTEVGAPIALPLGAAVSDNRLVGQVRTGQFEVAILDDNDEAVANGVVGEIAVRAMEPWTLMAGYWNRPEATISAWRNLWLHSGDAGRSDEAGNIYFVDRLKDAIRRRGENISSMEVEDVIRQHPSVQECAVFPVPAEHGEEEVMAAIVVKPGLVLDPTELIGFLTPRMAYFMLPRYVDLLDDLPKTPTGKIQKYALRQRGAAATTWDRETAGLKIAR